MTPELWEHFLETVDIRKECLFTHERGRGEEYGAHGGTG
jgi:hypothetical protein